MRVAEPYRGDVWPSEVAVSMGACGSTFTDGETPRGLCTFVLFASDLPAHEHSACQMDPPTLIA